MDKEDIKKNINKVLDLRIDEVVLNSHQKNHVIKSSNRFFHQSRKIVSNLKSQFFSLDNFFLPFRVQLKENEESREKEELEFFIDESL